MYISDEEWERTSPSWKTLKPLKNFNQLKDTDESERQCYERLSDRFNIPFDVISQWIYPHYFNRHTVNNYGWIDYSNCHFHEVNLEVSILTNLHVIKDFQPYVTSRESAKPFDDFCCMSQDKAHWESRGTWRIPPIVLDVDSLMGIPSYSEIRGPFQLIEGHSRLGYFLALKRAGILSVTEHKVYLLSCNS